MPKVITQSLLVSSFILTGIMPGRLLAAPAPRKAALGKVTWIAVSSHKRKKLLSVVRRIAAASSIPVAILDGCKTQRSCRRAARRAQAAVLLTARVEALGNTYLFRIQARCLDTDRKETKAVEQRAACEVCTLPEAGRSLGKALVASAQRTRQTLCASSPQTRPAQTRQTRITTGPSAAARRTPAPGRTTAARASARTSRPQASSQKAGGDDTQTQPSKPGASRARLGATLKLSGWILGGLSLGALAAGSVLLALDGKGTCSGSGECPKVYDFKAPGIAGIALGGLGLAAGVTMVLLGYHWSKEPERQADLGSRPRLILTAAPMPGGLSLGAAGRF